MYSVILTELGIGVFENEICLKSFTFREPVEDYVFVKKGESRLSDLAKFLSNVEKGIEVNDHSLLDILKKKSINVQMMNEEDSAKIQSSKPKILEAAGFATDENDAMSKLREFAIELSSSKVSEVSESPDLHIIQAINTLDDTDKIINGISSRLREWYGLHFPELTDKIIEDNITIARLVSFLGSRENFTIENLKNNFNLNERKIEILELYAAESMGADIELPIIQGYADQIISLDTYRQELENYLEDLMEKAAPNINALVGSLIGAKLIAKAGGLQKLAYMPASRIQLLGAEKALYRFLKTGEKRPKHGLIFQWNLIRGSKPWNRGKISRVISGKIGISAKVDYFGGEFIADMLSKEINEKIHEIEKKLSADITI